MFITPFSLHCSGEPRDQHVVIVDDLVQTGGTLIECAKVSSTPYTLLHIHTHYIRVNSVQFIYGLNLHEYSEISYTRYVQNVQYNVHQYTCRYMKCQL